MHLNAERDAMNGIHDLGGLTCFGPVEREGDEPRFHEEWERRVFALTLASLGGGLGPVDAFRHAIERMDPVQYLETTYYEHWLEALETRVADRDLAKVTAGDEPLTPDIVDAVIAQGVDPTRETDSFSPRFAVGDPVRAKNWNPSGHTRLPRYARGRRGVIALIHGNHVYPDTYAHDRGENAQPLYSVKFSAHELWGDDAPRHDHLFIDLWESYLEAPTL